MNLLKVIIELFLKLFNKSKPARVGPPPDVVAHDFKKAFPIINFNEKQVLDKLIVDKIFYNEASAEKMNWEPSWFGVEDNDEELIEAVKTFQLEHGLQADGLVGPTTFRRIWTSRESEIDVYKPSEAKNANKINHLVHNGEFY